MLQSPEILPNGVERFGCALADTLSTPCEATRGPYQQALTHCWEYGAAGRHAPAHHVPQIPPSALSGALLTFLAWHGMSKSLRDCHASLEERIEMRHDNLCALILHAPKRDATAELASAARNPLVIPITPSHLSCPRAVIHALKMTVEHGPRVIRF